MTNKVNLENPKDIFTEYILLGEVEIKRSLNGEIVLCVKTDPSSTCFPATPHNAQALGVQVQVSALEKDMLSESFLRRAGRKPI